MRKNSTPGFEAPDGLQVLYEYMKPLTEKLIQDCNASWRGTQPLARSRRRPLYHYSHPEAFRQITETGVVWATDIRYMNDASELLYASKLWDKIIQQSKIDKRSDELEFLDIIAKSISPNTQQVFAFCCSEEPDSIPQWVAYAGRRGGFALGLDLTPELTLARSPDNAVQYVPELIKVSYDLDIQTRILSEAVLLLLLLYRDARNHFDEPLWVYIRAEISSVARQALLGTFLTIKEPGFEHEQEWRLTVPLSLSEQVASYRVGQMGLVPFLPLKLTHTAGPSTNRLPLTHVTVGPTAEPALSRAATEAFLRSRRYGLMSVVSSEMPLRF